MLLLRFRKRNFSKKCLFLWSKIILIIFFKVCNTIFFSRNYSKYTSQPRLMGTNFSFVCVFFYSCIFPPTFRWWCFRWHFLHLYLSSLASDPRPPSPPPGLEWCVQTEPASRVASLQPHVSAGCDSLHWGEKEQLTWREHRFIWLKRANTDFSEHILRIFMINGDYFLSPRIIIFTFI